MRIHIGTEGTQFIKGYHSVIVKDQNIDLNAISNNECTEILANDILDEFRIENIGSVIQALLSKLRIGGKLVLGGTDILLFCKAVQDGSLSEAEYSNIIASKQSMTQAPLVLETLRGMGLNVEIYDINGIHFEVAVRR